MLISTPVTSSKTHSSSIIIFIRLTPARMASYIWPSFIVWGLDRLIRAIRLVLFNHSYFGLKSGSGTMDASTELLSDHLVRLTMNRPPHFHWAPGQTAYLILPSVSSLPFEAHPFTIASLDSSLLEDKTATKLDEKALGKSAPYWKELVFLINVRDGFTKRLKEISIQKGKVKTFIDGPYGPSPNLSQYDTSVLIAGKSFPQCSSVARNHNWDRRVWGFIYFTSATQYFRVSLIFSLFLNGIF